MNNELKIRHYNRRVKRLPKRGETWCRGCDMTLVSDGGKCKICGTRCGHKRDKKYF